MSNRKTFDLMAPAWLIHNVKDASALEMPTRFQNNVENGFVVQHGATFWRIAESGFMVYKYARARVTIFLMF